MDRAAADDRRDGRGRNRGAGPAPARRRVALRFPAGRRPGALGRDASCGLQPAHGRGAQALRPAIHRPGGGDRRLRPLDAALRRYDQRAFSPMTTAHENEILTRIGPGTAMGALLRRYWLPVLLASE